jgi:hypothetical protein
MGSGSVKESDAMNSNENENEKQFHGWRLIAVIMGVIVVLALISAAVDWMVLR